VVRAALRETAPGLPVFKIRTFRQHAEDSIELWAMNLGSALLTVFSLFAMLVAVVGIYSVKAYQVSRRTREIGIRMALGALPGAVQSLILCEGLATALGGTSADLLGAGVNRLLSSVMYGLKPFDPAVLLLAAGLFLAAATFACWLPARKATRVNPLDALRSE
jgi:ABC-type antimicrobial peptide transport system permease subunit